MSHVTNARGTQNIPESRKKITERTCRLDLSRRLSRLRRETRTFMTLLSAAIGDSEAEASIEPLLVKLLDTYRLAERAATALLECPGVSPAGRAAAESGQASLELAALGLELVIAGCVVEPAA
jgi:hypothetical protein